MGRGGRGGRDKREGEMGGGNKRGQEGEGRGKEMGGDRLGGRREESRRCMHTKHAHWVFGNSLMSHLLDAAWHCLQAEKKRNQTCVYV